ncbi:MAG TPA: hypothetical protein VJV79_30395 [Polyangiaceae bacterium]|nr:hypothetical protein [Polyangiaceae bacterium]
MVDPSMHADMASDPSNPSARWKTLRSRSLIEWLVIGALALLGFFVVWWVYRPGFMSWDSVVQLRQARAGAYSDDHPPIVALIWRSLDRCWPGPIGMLILFDALFWLGLGVFFRLLRWPLWARASALVVVGFQPAVFMLLGTIWKDTLMQAALLAGFSALLLAGLGARRWWWALAVPLFFVGIAARHNAIAAAWPLLAVPIFYLQRLARWRRHWQLAVSLALGLVLALILRQGSVLLSRSLTEPSEYWQTTPIFDLVGMSLQLDEQLIPPESGVLSPGVTLARLRQVYDPTDHLRLYKCPRKNCTPALNRSADAVQLRALSSAWKRAILAHPRAYLAHRWLVFRELLRLGKRKIELSTGISRNPLGIPLTRSEAGTAAVQLLSALPKVPFYATWLFALLECALFAIGAVDFFKRGRPLCLCLSMSGLLYLLTFFLATGAPDFRYSVWTILTTLLAACSLAGIERPASARGPAGAPAAAA